MKWFNDEKLSRLQKQLKYTELDFKFDHQGVKNHLMQSIVEQKYSQAGSRAKFGMRRRVVSWAAGSLALVVFISSGTLAFADNSAPGDKLFFLDKFQEKIILSLPLPSEKRADVQAKIVTERMNELTELKKLENQSSIKLRAVKESEESVTRAIESVTTVKTELEKRGKSKQAEQLDSVLNRLDDLAGKQETEISEIKKKLKEKGDVEKADKSLLEIKKARNKVRTNSPDLDR